MMVPTPPSSEKIPMRQDNNIAEAEKMGIIFMFFGEQISNIGIPWEVGDKDFGKPVSITYSHVADINMPHLFVSTVVGPVHSTSIFISKRSGRVTSGMWGSLRIWWMNWVTLVPSSTDLMSDSQVLRLTRGSQMTCQAMGPPVRVLMEPRREQHSSREMMSVGLGFEASWGAQLASV